MSLLIDTSILVALEREDKAIISNIDDLRKSDPSPPSISLINYFEFMYGIQKRNAKNKSDAISFIELFEFLTPTKKTAIILADLKYKYEKLGESFSLSDLFIASQAIENNMLLVTRDKHFNDLEELKKIIL